MKVLKGMCLGETKPQVLSATLYKELCEPRVKHLQGYLQFDVSQGLGGPDCQGNLSALFPVP